MHEVGCLSNIEKMRWYPNVLHYRQLQCHYCCAVFHGCGKGNEEELECLQRRAAGIVLKTVHLSTQDMVSGLVWDPLKTRREKHIVKLVRNCLDGQAPSYSQIIFDGELMIFMTMTLGLRIGYLLIKSILS